LWGVVQTVARPSAEQDDWQPQGAHLAAECRNSDGGDSALGSVALFRTVAGGSMRTVHHAARLLDLRQHQRDGVRSPHKPLLVLLALSQLDSTGCSELQWSAVESRLADLIRDFGPPSKAGARQSAAYPFTRLRSDGVWQLTRDVPMDRVAPLDEGDVIGHFTAKVESELRADRASLLRTARALVDSEFPPTLARDVLAAVGFDPDAVYSDTAMPTPASRRRSATWPAQVLIAWDRQCAFCGFDGQLGSGSVGLEAAHIRWFNFGGPDRLDNGLAMCALHHKLFDRGALGLDGDLHIQVSPLYTARTDVGRLVYDLADRRLKTRPGSPTPRPEHVHWHLTQVFKSA
jgi:putative restriction endonuclease